MVLGNCHITLYISLPNTGMPAQTATGTVAIQVEDFNDHCPTLTTGLKTMCTPLDSVIVAAIDEDSFPNGPPFDFSVVAERTEGKWKVEYLNGEENVLLDCKTEAETCRENLFRSLYVVCDEPHNYNDSRTKVTIR